MKTLKVQTLPTCNYCGADALFDAPTKSGAWAYMCETCFKQHGAQYSTHGYCLVQRDVASPKKDSKILEGIEPSFDDDPDYWENILMDSTHREIECPECGEFTTVEPDANYTYTCEGCGSKVKVPEPPC